MEGAASIHGDIHEAAPSELWEKASFAPTNEPSLAYLEFLWNQYALSDFWLFHVQQRSCWAWGMEGFFFKLQTETIRKHPSSWEKIEKNKELITCPMYEPFTRPSALGTGRWSQTSLYHVRIPVDACDPWSTDKAVIWRHFLSPVPVVPSPKDHEWGINVDEQLVIQWMCGATAPDTALQLMFSMSKR